MIILCRKPVAWLWRFSTSSRNNALITSAQAQAQEIEADTFARDVMRRIGVAPLAMSQFFMLSNRFEATQQDFQSTAEYQAQLARSTHPVSALRLEKVAANIEDNLDVYANAQDDPPAYRKTLASNVDDLRRIASELTDSSMRECLELKLRDMNTKQLRRCVWASRTGKIGRVVHYPGLLDWGCLTGAAVDEK